MTIQMSDRELIDAAIAAGMVRKIPRGVSGLDPDKGRDWKVIGLAILENNRKARRFRAPKPQPVKVERAATKEGVNDQIRSMRLSGMSYRDIAASLGMSSAAVFGRCAKMDLPSGSTSS